MFSDDSCLLGYDTLYAGKQAADVSKELAILFLDCLGIGDGGSGLFRNVGKYLRFLINIRNLAQFIVIDYIKLKVQILSIEWELYSLLLFIGERISLRIYFYRKIQSSVSL
jgi:hypothetical protein